MKPLKWGLTRDEVIAAFPMVVANEGSISIKSLTLKPFGIDCGALILTNANSATKETLKLAVKVASANGFSKIFATVVIDPEWSSSVAPEAFKHCKFKLVSKSKSNRNPEKDDYVFVKIIRNCKYKGY